MISRIVLNIPHSGTDGLQTARWDSKPLLMEVAREWTDWHTDQLFRPYADRFDVERDFSIHVFPKSRFVVDVERLQDDPLESVGQGIVYTAFSNGMRREVSEEEREMLLGEWRGHMDGLRENCRYRGARTLLIDCHSFPSKLSDVDVCLGFNDDFSRPAGTLIKNAREIFERAGYKVGINEPYSNSIQPLASPHEQPCGYSSLMIEVNKRTYLNEYSLQPSEGFKRMRHTINEVYAAWLTSALPLHGYLNSENG